MGSEPEVLRQWCHPSDGGGPGVADEGKSFNGCQALKALIKELL